MDKSKAIAGGGAWMIAAALQVVPQTWPTLLQPHPWGVGLFILVGAAMFIYAAFGRKESSGVSNMVGRDNSGDLIAAKDSLIHKGDVHHHYGSVATPASAAPQIRAPYIPKPDRRPVLVISANATTDFLYYDPNEEIWKIDIRGKRSLMISVANPIPNDGGESIKAVRISVHLRFLLDPFSTDVERAFWIEDSANEIELLAGTKRDVFVGFFNQDEWVCYENRYSSPKSYGSWGHISHRDYPVRKVIPFPSTATIKLEARVLYTDRDKTVKTIASKFFDIKVTANSIYHCAEVKP